ncbi:MAG: hypothetical protein ACXAD7_00035 [Candidatus Kariarchaeaceae archaeon]
MSSKTCVINICKRDADVNYCDNHLTALANLRSGFSEWVIAFGNKFTFQDYLKKITTDNTIEFGSWVRDVAKYMVDEKLNLEDIE